MKSHTQKLYELTIEADEVFINKHQHISTSVGLMDKALRKKGIEAEAVTVDLISSTIRVILVILDHNPSLVGVGVGSTAADDIELLSEYMLDSLAIVDIVSVLEEHLVVQ